MSYGELDRLARLLGVRLQSFGAESERALLLYPPGLEFIVAFLGCLYGALIAVPTYPPRGARGAQRLRSIARDARPRFVLTTRSLIERLRAAGIPELDGSEWIVTDDPTDEEPDGWSPPRLRSDSLAFLQYTSGSTAAPKGVMVSHGNLLHNERIIQSAFRQSERSVVVGWLPLYHDMGLIGTVLQPLYSGSRAILMPATAFLQKPRRWLAAISRFRADTSGGPNFAYELCTRRITREQREGLDLSSWRVAFNGAEPVHWGTLERFEQLYEPYGFRRAAFFPCYGLAESTLMVSGGRDPGSTAKVLPVSARALARSSFAPPDEGEPVQQLVSCGHYPPGEARVEIVEPESGDVCRAGGIGEIWVASRSVAHGYWGRPQETAEIYRAFLADGRGPFLRTGDLGFLEGGELFVTGRIKDLIIVRGRNHYPQDIELTVENSHPVIRPGCGAAFSVERDGEEQLVVACEVDRHAWSVLGDGEVVAEAARQAVAEEHELRLSDLVLLRTGGVPKTTSGKIQRFACRAAYLAGELPAVWSSFSTRGSAGSAESSNDLDLRGLLALDPQQRQRVLEAALVRRVARLLRVAPPRVEVDRPITALGLDSLTAMQLGNEIETGLDLRIPFSDLLEGMTVAQLAAAILEQIPSLSEPLTEVLAPESGEERFPLSYGQKALWFLTGIPEASTAYNISAAVVVRSALDEPALRRSFETLVGRHAALRMTFSAVDGEPAQCAQEEMRGWFQTTDASLWSRDRLKDRLHEEVYRPFDLERGPLFRVLVYKLASGEHALLIVVHHLVADFWSLAWLARELVNLYQQQKSGEPAELEPLTRSYSDYVAWQRGMLDSARGEEMARRWEQRLSGAPTVLDLPTDRRRPAVQSYRGGAERLILGPAIVAELERLSSSWEATLFMTLMAIFQTLLSRYTGQSQFLIGSPVAGRSSAEWAPIVGYFVNPVVFRADLSGRPSLEDLVARVRGWALEALEESDYPFSLLVERIRPTRDPSISPLFQVMMVFQQTRFLDEVGLAALGLGIPGVQLQMGDLELESLDLEARRSQFDLTLELARLRHAFATVLHYNSDLFDRSTVRRMLGHLEALLEAAVVEPCRPLHCLPLLGRAERRQTLHEWNDTGRERRQNPCLHEPFEAQAAATPDAVAVVYRGQAVTYGELDRRAHRIAQRLRLCGAGPETCVAVCLRRTPELVAGLLGILKAGAAYLPLDPSYPQARLAFMLQDAAAPLLLTEAALVERLPAHRARQLLLDDHPAPPETGGPVAAGRPPVGGKASSQNLAYLIYTSGSTGHPKAVAIEHRSATALTEWSLETYSGKELSGVLASTSICFDLSVYELFVPLSCGGRILMCENLLELPKLPDAGSVTLINTVPSALDELVRQQALPESVSTVNLAGEPLKGDLVRRIHSIPQRRRVFNLYGPSEDTVYSSWVEVPRPCRTEPTLGRPLTGTRFFLLDRHLQPVPLAAPGEICLAGAGLARGYLNRPAHTAGIFVPDPFSGIRGSRLYRTGDLARYLPDGQLVFLGRADHQVKLRGFRIELGEVAGALLKHPSVQEAVAVVRKDTRGEPQLAAYFTSHDGDELAAAELRSHLRLALPEYMVPAVFVQLSELPLTPSGKIDRRALPAPAWGARAGKSHDRPGTPFEQLLAGIWCELLGVERIDPEDHFFDCGGHSLLASRLLSRVRSRLGVELPLRAVYESSLRELAAQIEGALKQPFTSTAQGHKIEPLGRDEALPLSYAQERYWLLDQLTSGNPAYNLGLALRLRGNLGLAAMTAAVDELITRHEVFRTAFERGPQGPRQRPLPPSAKPLTVVDLRRLSAGVREREAERAAVAERDRVQDLAAGCGLRPLLIRLGKADHLAVFVSHHIVLDGSRQLFVKELAAGYREALTASGRRRARPEIDYADFAAWERRWLAGVRGAQQMAYWRTRLRAGEVPVLELPTDRPRPAARNWRGASLEFHFDEALRREIRAFCQRRGTTLYMTLLAALQALFYRYTEQRSIWIGSPIISRPVPPVERLMGCFMNTVVLAADLAADPPFDDLLVRTKNSALEAFAHCAVPFEMLVRELRPGRDLSRNPLFQVMFTAVELSLSGPELDFPGLEWSFHQLPSTRSRFDLLMSVTEGLEARLAGFVEFDTELFDTTTVLRLTKGYRTLLAGAVGAPSAPLTELPLITSAERHQLIREWNDTACPDARSWRIEELFEARAGVQPEAVAVANALEVLTYRELDRRATSLAGLLATLGVGPGTPVGVYLERSPAMVATLLGVLKAGGAYVPLNVADPAARLRTIIEVLDIRHLITQSSLVTPESPASFVHEVVSIDLPIPPGPTLEPAVGRSSEELAYVIFTSGSTGTPKGVMVRHRPVVNLIGWVNDTFGVADEDRVLFVTSLGFDLSVYDVFGLLAAGGTVRVASEAELRDPAQLLAVLRRERITFWDSAPAALQQLMPFVGEREVVSSRLRRVFLSGDWIPVGLPGVLGRAFPKASVVSLGGATEATVWSNVFPVGRVDPAWPSIPYGRPIRNARYHVLDGRRRPCPVGVPGDLYIGGGCLADGYSVRPELTAASFQPDDLAGEPGGRLYRTGDRARYWADGVLEFLGRRDYQVKVRGYRIELGEIESVLAQHPDVREAVVLARQDLPGSKRLVAYVVGREKGLDERQLAAFLRQRLPEYMVPVAWVVLAGLPLTASGKVDRKSLPAPRVTETRAAARALTTLEEAIAGLWQNLTGAELVGPDDDFFELGGDSLLATQLISRVRKSLGVEVPLRRVFEAPSLAEFTAEVTVALSAGGMATAPPIERLADDGRPIPLSFAQERLWFLDRLQPESFAYNIAAAIRFQGRLRTAALARAIGELVRRHEPLRTSFRAESGDLWQVIGTVEAIPLRVVDLSGLAGGRAAAVTAQLAKREGERPFDLAVGPLLRITLVRLGADEHVFLATLHHIAGDGWSMGILLEELAVLYRCCIERRPAPLPELPVRYADFARWQRRWLAGDVLAEQMAYWKRVLAGVPAILELPADRPRPPVLRYRGEVHRIALGQEDAQGLRQLSRARGATLFMTLLAIFKVLLLRYTGRRDLVVGSPVAGRNRTEIEGLIGLFVNSLVLRTDLAGNPPFCETLERVRETALGAYAHQDLPFEKLVDEMQIERDLSHSPLFQVLFQLLPSPLGRLELPELTLLPLDLEVRAAKLELVLSLEEDGAEVRGLWRYNTDIFDASSVARMSAHFRTLVANCVADPECRIEDLRLLSAAEHAQLVGEWNDTARTYPHGVLLHTLFERHAASHPDAVAVVFEESALTYGGLARRVDRLALELRSRGCGPESRVAVCVERCPELPVALLGVLKAGGAYVPLDPDYPHERLAFMLEDCAALALVTLRRHAAVLPEGSVPRVWLDAPARDWVGRRAGPAAVPMLADDHPAYVIYTSGSTGRPKGVMVSHRAIANRLLWMQENYGLGDGDRVLQKTPVSFDVSVWEFFWPLMSGAQMVLARPGGHRDGAYLARLIARRRITVLHFVPSMLQAFLEEGELSDLGSLRWVIASGEALGTALNERFHQRLGAPLDNLYGPTEAAVDVTFHSTAPGSGASSVPIGRPIANTRIHLLDRRLRVAPPGVPAELLIGGVNLARGYLGRPALTAERFVPDPLDEAAGGRLYRTGDLARHDAGGAIVFLGRLDHQVKVRGFRIELGEIEAVVAEDPTVREAAVLLRSAGAGDGQIVAYVVPVAGAPLVPTELRRRLAARLPEYMVPARFVELEALPLTPNGKLDRQALPAPDNSRPELGQPYVAPRNVLERELARHWCELLGVERIGVRDDFFELGGNSIQAAIFINKLQQTLGRIVHVVAVFDAPTIAGLADYLRARYPEAVAELWGGEALPTAGAAAPLRRVDETRLAELRRRILPAAPLPDAGSANPRAIFVLSPPRSGSTLLRVMLAGHPRLFAPPELELLSFATLAERQTALEGRYGLWLEGVLRAVMEVRDVDAAEAKGMMAELASRGLTTRQFYGLLQSWIGDRLLVDKTSTYALDVGVLERAEAIFDDAFYIHLLRHPCGMIRSFEEARLDEIFLRVEHPFATRELAEMIWTLSHQNILRFLASIPAARRHTLSFEDLVRDPQGTLMALCDALGLAPDPAMLQPYEGGTHRMSDGIHAQSRMLGDVKFHTHRTIDPAVADRWRQEMTEELLGEVTREVAAALGYAGSDELTAIESLGDGEPLPLSFAQERLWFLDRLSPGAVTYNVPAGLSMDGALRPQLLARSFAEVVRRHASLRTTFRTRGGEPVQVVSPAWRPALPVVDLSGLAVASGEAEARRLASALSRLPFDLERGPLLRLALLRLGGARHVLVLGLHHIVSDGWSMGLLLREMTAHYEAFGLGAPSPLPELAVQYGDFAVWQRRWLAGEISRRQLAYWRGELDGLPNLHLPADRPRPVMASGRGTTRPARWPAALGRAVRGAAQSAGTSLFMLLLAGFETLLGRYAGQQDFAIGTPVAGRNRAELEPLIGLFVNTLVVRSDLPGAATFRQLLSRVRQRLLGVFAHQELPFERLVDELHPERDLAHSPLFQALFVLQNAAPQQIALPGLTVEPLVLTTGTAKFDLNLLIAEEGDEIALYLEYATDLFDATTAGRLLGHYRRLLAAAVAEPERRVAELPLLGAGERQQLMVEWNDTAQVPRPPERCLHELFEIQAGLIPDTVALVTAGERLSYRELDRRARILAHELRQRGVGPEVRVGLCAARTPDLVMGLLAVLKAGGAYVPLDVEYPQERLAFILADAQTSLVLVDASRPPALGSDPTPTLALRRDWRQRPAPDGEPETPSGVRPDHLAYVIYTSGSTGLPKGVAIAHRSLVALLEWSRRVFSPPQLAGVLASTSVCFDLSLFELFVPLSRGGTVVLAADALELPSHPAAGAVRLINTVPSAVAELLRFGPLPSGLRTVNLAGEPLRRDLVEAIYARPGIEAVFNLYGPSEDTTYSTFARIPSGVAAPPAIGRPVGDSRAYVLDRALQPVPPGVTGELNLAGLGLARGYLARPALTAERFVPDLWSARAGSRSYRTGDLARYRTDGELEFLGRLDHQVKVRGFRIELGEVETVLRSHNEVQEAVVLAREDTPGDRRLVAYVVAQGKPGPTATELAAFLGKRLPSFQIPGNFVFLASLPLTPNGKVDRLALPAPDFTRRLAPGVGGALRTPAEEVLAGIWAQVLNIPRVEPDEDFFALGGHSLLATQVVSRVRELFAVELPLRSLFQHPTLGRLAREVERAAGSVLALEEPEASSDEGPAPLSFAQERLWFFEHLAPGTPVYNMAATIGLSGPLDVAALRRSLDEILVRHDSLRIRFTTREGQPVQIVEPLGRAPFAVLDLSNLAPAEATARSLAKAEGRRPFDLGRGPLMRALLLRFAATEHVLLLTTHHIVCDGWSLVLLERELTVLYEAFSRGEPSPLPEPSLRYTDFARWQRRYLQGEVLATQLRFWKEHLAGAPPYLELPFDRPRPPQASYRGAVHRFVIDRGVTAELEELCRREGQTLFMALLATFAIALHRFSGESDLVIGSNIANRHRRSFEGMIGLLANTVALRVDVTHDPSVRELLAAVRESALLAYEHQDLPFEKLVEELRIERHPTRSPLFQVMLILQNAPSAAVAGRSGLTVTPLPADSEIARYDLVLFMAGEDGELRADLSYSTDLFDAGTVEFLSGTFKTLLAAVPGHVDGRISELPFAGGTDQESLVGAFTEEIEM